MKLSQDRRLNPSDFAPSHIRHGMYHPRIVHTNGLPKSVTMYEGQRFLKNGYGIGPDDLEMAMIRVGDYDLLISSSQSENVIDGGNDRFLIEKLRSESFKSSTSFQLQLVDFKANSLFIENGLLIQLRGKSEIESASMIKWDFCYLNQHNLTLCQDLGSELLLIEF